MYAIVISLSLAGLCLVHVCHRDVTLPLAGLCLIISHVDVTVFNVIHFPLINGFYINYFLFG